MSALDDVAAERAAQDRQWGGAEHDDEHGMSGWVHLIGKHVGRLNEDAFAETPRRLRRRAIVVAALCVAFAEALDRRYGTGETHFHATGSERARGGDL